MDEVKKEIEYEIDLVNFLLDRFDEQEIPPYSVVNICMCISVLKCCEYGVDFRPVAAFSVLEFESMIEKFKKENINEG